MRHYPSTMKRLFSRKKGKEKMKNYNLISEADLIVQSGISIENFKILKDANLVVPINDETVLYRSKLAFWCQKLQYLLNEGWKVSEIQFWARKRSKEIDPLLFPPNRDYWIRKMERTKMSKYGAK
jgi:hypothetical protein